MHVSKKKKFHGTPPKHIPYGKSQTMKEIHANSPGSLGSDPYLDNLEAPDVPLGVDNKPLDIERFADGTGKG